MADLNVEITRTNRKVHFEGVSDANPERRIPFDFAPPLGDGNGFAGLELLLMSFAGCVSTTVVFLLGRMGKMVGAYQASAQGVRREQPLSLAKIHLHLQLEVEQGTDAEMEAVLKQAEALSPVWQAVKNNIAVTVTYTLQSA